MLTTESPSAASDAASLDTRPPPGFESLFASAFLVCVLGFLLLPSIKALAERSPGPLLLGGGILILVNLVNLLRLSRARGGCLALILGLAGALLGRSLAPGSWPLVMALAPNVLFLAHDLVIAPAVARRRVERALKGLCKAESASEACALLAHLPAEELEAGIDLLLKLFRDDPALLAALTELPAGHRLSLLLRLGASRGAEQILAMLQSEDADPGWFTALEPLLQSPEDARLLGPGLLTMMAHPQPSARAAVAGMIASSTELSEHHPAAASCLIKVLGDEEPGDLFFGYDAARHFDAATLCAALAADAKLSPALLDVLGEHLGPDRLSWFLKALDPDRPALLLVAIGHLGARGPDAFAQSAEDKKLLRSALSQTAERIREVHPVGDNLVADDLVGKIEALLGVSV